MPEAHRTGVQLHGLGIDRNADDQVFVSISALYRATAAAYAGSDNRLVRSMWTFAACDLFNLTTQC